MDKYLHKGKPTPADVEAGKKAAWKAQMLQAEARLRGESFRNIGFYVSQAQPTLASQP
jgi:hypothetical protein